MSNLPVLHSDNEFPPRQLVRAVKAQRRTELAVFKHSLRARYEAECARLDTQALSDVVKTALEEEMGLMEWGLERAGGSPAKAELVARKLAMFSNINSQCIARRFGS
jgi:molybdopterin-guanine dinucleotide biosynthesis protein A